MPSDVKFPRAKNKKLNYDKSYDIIRLLISQPVQQCTAKSMSKLGLRLNLRNSLRHFAHPFPKFYTGDETVQNLALAFELSRLRRTLISK